MKFDTYRLTGEKFIAFPIISGVILFIAFPCNKNINNNNKKKKQCKTIRLHTKSSPIFDDDHNGIWNKVTEQKQFECKIKWKSTVNIFNIFTLAWVHLHNCQINKVGCHLIAHLTGNIDLVHIVYWKHRNERIECDRRASKLEKPRSMPCVICYHGPVRTRDGETKIAFFLAWENEMGVQGFGFLRWPEPFFLLLPSLLL